jgi:hypothetical protein
MANNLEGVCCRRLRNDLEAGGFVYNEQLREFTCNMRGKEDYCQVVRYCPYCGVELKSLANEYRAALAEALGKEFCDIKEDEIPEEFKSDEWWRKRGL